MTGLRMPTRPPAFVVREGGRRLAYTEWGARDGRPVIHFHGMPGSRLEVHAPDRVYLDAGVRLITVDRPGCGASDRQPGRTLLDWPADVAALADQLGLRTFGVTALSGGGPYALACAARMPERLTGVAIAGCAVPTDGPLGARGMKRLNRFGLFAARRLPWLMVGGYTVLAAILNRSPDAFVSLMTADKPGADLRLLADEETRAGIEAMLVEAIRGGVVGAVEEVGLLARPWGFAPAEAAVPIDLWHGDLDDTAPMAAIEGLARAIPRARLHRCRGEGHMVMWTHLAEILTAATGAAPAVRPAAVPA